MRTHSLQKKIKCIAWGWRANWAPSALVHHANPLHLLPRLTFADLSKVLSLPTLEVDGPTGGWVATCVLDKWAIKWIYFRKTFEDLDLDPDTQMAILKVMIHTSQTGHCRHELKWMFVSSSKEKWGMAIVLRLFITTHACFWQIIIISRLYCKHVKIAARGGEREPLQS